ncbi:DUF4278 domain-containing protein [Nostoc flagelliforme FACHB-838]|uniref:DUF4278 domain-containing protein n=1 Tax=Nostoc flagelliforme FACHB-838 TaxID=2692904 RepID=A0ABR8E4W9_9NOSO|nr:DUF4278 domain-containing protein [Nostoc flagelliforme]MBD2535575.1 DUF4278 domain-containing protein [Nostoc flagelliforme FACHB-838]
MKLNYRGLSYELDSSKIVGRTIEKPFQSTLSVGAAYDLIYRGVIYRVGPNAKSAEAPLPPTTYKLSYREINYLVNRNAQGEVTLINQSTNSLQVDTQSPLTTLPL